MCRKSLILPCLALYAGTVFAQNADSLFIKQISDEILTHSGAYDNLKTLTKTIGHRLAGSPQMYKAESWGYNALLNAGAPLVYRQPCMVPHWVRGGKDTATAYINGKATALHILALGNSVGTGARGLSADVILINSFEELDAKKELVKNKIVFYNYKFNPTFIHTFDAYSDAVKYRGGQATAAAAKYGAVATVVRSMSHSVDNLPHTGATRYDTAYRKNPAVAIGLQDADWLAAQLQSGNRVTVYIKANGHFLTDVAANNIIAEWKGAQYPNEIITVGGHLDSWDVGEGAHDDGAGVTQTIEIIRAFKALHYQPLRTIRFVLFANEENGTRGGQQYAAQAAAQQEKHIFVLESDAGGFTPRGFGITCSDAQFAKISAWENLLKPYGGGDISRGGGGTDVTPLHNKTGAPMGELLPDSQRYFDIHHTRNDVLEQVNKRELELGAINMAALIYLIDKYGL